MSKKERERVGGKEKEREITIYMETGKTSNTVCRLLSFHKEMNREQLKVRIHDRIEKIGKRNDISLCNCTTSYHLKFGMLFRLRIKILCSFSLYSKDRLFISNPAHTFNVSGQMDIYDQTAAVSVKMVIEE